MHGSGARRITSAEAEPTPTLAYTASRAGREWKMATAVTSQEDGASPEALSRETSPYTALHQPAHDSGVRKTNGYAHSPLRSSQRLSSLVTDKELPTAPQESPGSGRPGTSSNSVRFNDASLSANTQTSGHETDTMDHADTVSAADVVSQWTGKRRVQMAGTSTPPERRSVQFARGTLGEEPTPLVRTATLDTEEDMGDETPVRERQGSFFGKLRALATSSGSSGHMRHPSSLGSGTPNAALSPQSERSEPYYPVEPSEGADADIEEEEESEREPEEEDGTAVRPRKRRKSKRPQIYPVESAPSTPKQSRFESSRFASFIRDQSNSNDATKTGGGSLRRSQTMSDTSGTDRENRAGVSEDEGRDRIRHAWRRGIEGARGLSYAARKDRNESPDVRRPGHLRRITGLGGTNALDGTSSSPFRAKVDRQTTTSAQKWRQVKAGLKMLGQRRRDERMRVDHQKSAQLMAELLAGAPAALVFASMFQRDEHDHRKIPVLLEQLKIRIPDSQIKKENSGDRHLVFKVDLEYGNGPARMKWTIWRSLNDFVNLHAKYQAQAAVDRVRHPRGGENRKRAKMPRFPRSAFPFARSWRGLFDNLMDDESEDDQEPEHENQIPMTPGAVFTPGVMGLEDLPESPTTPGASSFYKGMGGMPFTPGFGPSTVATPGPSTSAASRHRRQKSSNFTPPPFRRTSTAEIGPLPENPEDLDARQRELYQRRQRRKLETYLQQMIRWLIFRADSTRLCKFLELSALAIRLSAEGGFQGKQGLLTIASRRQRELRRKPLGPGGDCG